MNSQNQFGKQRLDDFYVDKSFLNLNHGSYGYSPKSVIQYKRKMQEQMEFNGQKWFRTDLQIMINQARTFIAQKVNCRQQNLFMVQNATDAFNGLMKSLNWKEGDIILLPNIAYASIRKTCEWLRDKYKIQILDLNFTVQDFKSPETIQVKIQDQINKFPRKIKCAVFDHISSVPAIVFPIQTIQLFLQQKNIDLFVDGAHAICQVDIDLTRLQCEAYFSNFHKWAFAPKNAAFIYISNKYIKDVRPAQTGNFRGQGIDRQYFWTGTRDCTSYLAVPKGIQYLQSFGFNAVRNYNHSLVIAGAESMALIWNTSLLTEDQRCIGYIANVKLPCQDIKVCTEIQKELQEKYNCYIVLYKFDGIMFARICAQIYNDLQDYENSANLFLKVMNYKLDLLAKQ